jgi:intraflagellar transport protein 22
MNRGSSDINHIKIVVIGPSGAGKSCISNFIAEMPEVLKPNYHPTVGVRILEFEKEAPRNQKRPGQEKILVELWDVSGDTKYDRCWPAIMKGAHGVVLVYNAENPKHENEMDAWVNAFPKKMSLNTQFCVALAHHPSGRPINSKSKPRKYLKSE